MTGRERQDSRLKGLWDQLLGKVRQQGDGSLLEAYLSHSVPVRQADNVLVVEVPNVFTKEKLEKEFSREIHGMVSHLGEGISELTYQVKEAGPEASAARKPKVAELPAAPAEPEAEHAANLNPDYTFETFIVGRSNQYPHAVARSVSVTPGKVYNPVYYYGGVGLGKTHLMQAIGHEILRTNSRARVLFVSSEVFHNEYIDYIQNRKPWDRFRKKYRDIDCLLLDDVQFLESGERIQEEFFHTFEALKNRGKQIVLTGDRTPHQLQKMHERLRSRFASGVVVDLIPPDDALRIAILRSKAEEEGIDVPDEVIRYIAEKVSSNIRELQAVMRTAVAKSSVLKLPLSISLVEEVLRSTTGPQKPRELTIEMIQEEVCELFGISREELIGRRRDRRVVGPRQVAMYLSRELAGKTLMEIGGAFGKKDHTTVLHSCSKVEEDLEKSDAIKDNVEKLRIRLREKLG